ncbi:MAG: hypothetical protein RLZ95_1122 [Bacteroidota bacterium]
MVLGQFKNSKKKKMKKFILPVFIFSIFGCIQNASAQLTPKEVISVFPYEQVSNVNAALESMEKWGKSDWTGFFKLVEDSAQKVKFTYALHAYVNKASLDINNKNTFSAILSKQLKKAKSEYAKILFQEELKLLSKEDYVNSRLQLVQPKWEEGPGKTFTKTHLNPVQHLLDLQKQLEKVTNPIQKKNIIWEASKISGITSFMFVAKFLQDQSLATTVANTLAKIALNDVTIRGTEVRNILENALPLIHGEDSATLVPALIAHLKKMPYDYGFVSLFNGKDLTGWKGLVGNPIARSKMSDTALQAAQIKADIKMKEDWEVKDGLLNYKGNLHGENLATEKLYGDIEMFIDWKIQSKGDAGIYLRGTPQVQIWDTSRREVGAQVGSGGLYNNQKNVSKPLVVADNAIGEWNNFHIIMRGDKVTVYLNGVLVTDNITLENYWNRTLPLFVKEQIELQAHGTFVSYRNIYLRELPSNEAIILNEQELKDGFTLLFDGTNLNDWTGNKAGYLIQEGALVVNPEKGSGGNLYTKNEYSDFIYRFEFQLTPGANNGIGVHAPLEGDAAYVGMEVQVLDGEHPKYAEIQPYQHHGSVYGVIPAKRGYLNPTGEWNSEEIMVKGTKIKVTLNGTVILDGDYAIASKNGTMDHNQHPGLFNKTGHIGFLGHGDIVRFKNMRIKTL